MAAYWCAECGLPGDIPIDRNPDWRCWACRGPVVSDIQLYYWDDLPFKTLLDERLRQLQAGESVELAGHPGVRFAIGAAADMLLLLDALGAEPPDGLEPTTSSLQMRRSARLS